MSSSSHRHLSHAAAARERRQLVNVALATVLAFVVAGMVVVLARHNDQPLAAGDVAVPPLSSGSVAVSAVAGSATGSIGAATGGTHRSSSTRSSPAGPAARGSTAGSTAGSAAGSTATGGSASAGIAGIATSRAAGASRSTHPGGHAASSSRAGAGSGSTTHRANPPVHTSPTRGATQTQSATATASHPAAPTTTPPTHITSKPASPPAPTTHPVTSTVPPPPPPASSVTISQGDRVPFYECFALHCYYVAIQLNNFTAGSHSVTCSNSRDGDFYTFTTSNTYEAHSCFVWHSDVQVWVTIDGIRSNTLTWNPGHHH
jgi:hypothetical protein